MHGVGTHWHQQAAVAQLHILSKYFHIEFPVLMWHGNSTNGNGVVVLVVNIKFCHTTRLVPFNHTQYIILKVSARWVGLDSLGNIKI